MERCTTLPLLMVILLLVPCWPLVLGNPVRPHAQHMELPYVDEFSGSGGDVQVDPQAAKLSPLSVLSDQYPSLQNGPQLSVHYFGLPVIQRSRRSMHPIRSDHLKSASNSWQELLGQQDLRRHRFPKTRPGSSSDGCFGVKMDRIGASTGLGCRGARRRTFSG
uniref:Natriuretic peptide n=1 Tax=Myxine glutinosa TaxID=7769 RepID=Q402A6_MYXGL|nr:natriuretic peptide [Myxine glutinosa]